MKNELKHKSDEQLYALLKNKTSAKAAFDELYERYSTKLYNYCRKILNNQELAEDIFQETFTRFYESAQVDRPMSNVAGYLVRIARNLCLNEKVKKHNDNVPLEDFHFPTYDTNYDKKELADLLETAIEDLPDQYREVIILKEYFDMSYKDIAETLNTTMPVIRIRIYRARNKIKELMAPYMKDFKSEKNNNL
ncbi:MAG: RNA polymerase sigma factor [Bacteroidota bacterium]